MEAGRPHDIRPIAPCEARRIEAGIFNYGSDMTIENNPFEVMGLERLVEPQDADYIGKAALERDPGRGRRRGSSSASRSPGDALPFELAEKRPALHDGETVGTVTDLIWSPRLEKNIGYVWLPIELAGPGTQLEIEAPGRRSRAAAQRPRSRSSTPRKKVPLGLSRRYAAGGVLDDERRPLVRNAPSRQAMNSAIETTATMIVEIALIWGVTPNLIEL